VQADEGPAPSLRVNGAKRLATSRARGSRRTKVDQRERDPGRECPERGRLPAFERARLVFEAS